MSDTYQAMEGAHQEATLRMDPSEGNLDTSLAKVHQEGKQKPSI